MYGQYVHWRQTLNQDAEDKDNRDEGRAPRQQDNEQPLEPDQQEDAEFASRIEQWRKQRAQRQPREQQYNGHRHRKHRDKSRQPSASPQPTDSPSPEPTSGDASPPGPSTVDRLARKLSKQNLQHHNRMLAQSSGQLTPSPLQSMPAVVAEPSDSSEKPEDKRLESVSRLRRHASARALEARLQAMIDNETQCSVRSEPPAPPPPATTSTTARPWPAPTPVGQPVCIEVDPDCAMPNWDGSLEVDENDTADMSLDDLASSVRHAYVPSGVRKHSIGGVALRYRSSVDVALRCQNVVRNRPRMRKRDKSRHGSTVSSAMASAISSPVISPSIPSSSTMPPPPLP
ncbi:hypothetical protein QBC40DRAFT_68245 [Triangularia verruculosa]|uniref:Uncharacterized protein n=1 Tax=Triangularia verruculosa TaxID=2587418 RepID=A0AAN6XI50_9PEZI|nr:hypothetical protein QBC40DRAFT_68245 [Triangularia verruculosa]